MCPTQRHSWVGPTPKFMVPVKTGQFKTKKTKDKLPAADVRACQEILLEKRNMILGDLSKMEVATLRASEQDSSMDNMADYGTDNYEQDFTLSLMENVEGVIQEIDLALKRIEEGEYGVCEACGCVIPKARLMALPYARHCVQCQSKMEDF